MKLFLILLGGIVVLLSAGLFYIYYQLNYNHTTKDLSQEITKEAEKTLTKANLIGVVVGVYKDGKPAFYGFGQTESGVNEKPRPASIFQIGSISKLFTAQTAHILHKEGILSLDDTLEKLIPHPVLPLDANVKSITLRQLITHTSGFPSVPAVMQKALIEKVGKENVLVNPYSYFKKEHVYAYLNKPEDTKKPGDFEYSNYGMGLAGHILEDISGKKLEDLVQEKLFKGLDMNHTWIEPIEGMKPLLIPGYNEEGKPNPYWDFPALAGAGAYYSSAEDLMKYAIANLSSLREGGWQQADILEKFFGNKDVIWHNGRVGGFSSYLSLDPKNKTAVIVLSNKTTDITLLGVQLTRLVRIHNHTSRP